MRRKLIAFALVFLLVMACAIPAGATGAEVAMAARFGVDGDEITVCLSVQGAESGSLTVNYGTELTLAGTETGMALADIAETPGCVTIAWTTSAQDETGLLALTFAGAKCGTYEFLVGGTVFDSAYQPQPVEDFTISVYVPCSGEDCPSAAYTDLDTEKWYHEAVDYVLIHELMVGTGEKTFAPNANVTRAMVVKVLAAIEGIDPDDYVTRSFRDVGVDAWYAPYVEWAHKSGLANGYGEGIFAPNRPVTREEMATFFYRYWLWKNNEFIADPAVMEDFSDADQIASWSLEAMQWAVQTGLMEGMGDGTLNPRGTATRAQIAKIVMVYMTGL